MPGLVNYVSLTNLNDSGYINIYNQPNSAFTLETDVSTWADYCDEYSILCLAGGVAGSDQMRVLACGNCLSVTNFTIVNIPAFNGLAWWFHTSAYSIGFAPNSTVNQGACDIYDLSSELRLSWHTTGTQGGYRAGTLLSYGNYVQKYVFYKNMPAFTIPGKNS